MKFYIAIDGPQRMNFTDKIFLQCHQQVDSQMSRQLWSVDGLSGNLIQTFTFPSGLIVITLVINLTVFSN